MPHDHRHSLPDGVEGQGAEHREGEAGAVGQAHGHTLGCAGQQGEVVGMGRMYQCCLVRALGLITELRGL